MLIDNFIYFPERDYMWRPDSFELDYEDVWITTDDDVRIHGWQFPAEPDTALVSSECRGIMLFFHGNAGNISHRLDNVKYLVRMGIPLLIIDYRGYGESEGQINEDGFYIDSLASFDYLAGRYPPERIIVFGRSLGGAAAVHVASERNFAGLILESTFTNAAAVFGAFAPPEAAALMQGILDSGSKISRAGMRKLFLHGDMDDIVPYELGVKLFENAPEPKEFVTMSETLYVSYGCGTSFSKHQGCRTQRYLFYGWGIVFQHDTQLYGCSRSIP